MLINGIDLSSLGASLHDRILSNNRVKTSEKWVDGSIEPTFIRQQDSFKSMTLQFLVTEKNEEDAFIVMSNITMLLKRAIIIFDDMPNLQFDVSVVGETKQERLKNGNFLLTVKLKSDYAKGETEIHTTNTSATEAFNLTVVYYKDGNQLISTETVKIRAIDFVDKDPVTYADLGISLNKHQEAHYDTGRVTNFSGELTYETLYDLGTLIINYAPTAYYKEVEYYLFNGESYELIDTVTISFTYQLIQSLSTIGQLVDLNKNRPNGYKATCKFDQEFTFENLVNFPTAIPVYYDIAEDEQVKEINVNYIKETENGDVTIQSQTLLIRESDVVDGSTIGAIIELNKYLPQKYYKNGYCVEIDDTTLITFDTLYSNYTIRYDRIEEEIYVEYYNGTYPGWSRSYTDTLKLKYKESYDQSQDIIADLNININKYKTQYYSEGIIFNSGIYETYDDVIGIKVIQIFYPAKEYTVTAKYMQDDGTGAIELNTRDYVVTDLMFASEPELGNIIAINLYRPDGYMFDEENSYSGEVSLAALVSASPIVITYKPVAVIRTKSIVLKYYKQMKNTFSTINTSVITIEEATVKGGIRLRDLINLDQYKPEYYNSGIIDGYSADAFVTFDEINGNYDIYYYVSSYSTQVRYYTDEIATENWIGSSNITYTILSFETETTLPALGLNINEFKPPYCEDGHIEPIGGPVTFETLRRLTAINVIYLSKVEPDDPTGIDYPHRILFLHHNDFGDQERNMPNSWTLNHAYINTGVIAEDISQTTVQISTLYRPGQKIYTTTPPYSYLFGAKSPRGSMYIGYWNKKFPYDSIHSLDCYYIAKAGAGSETTVLDPDPEHHDQPSGNAFSRNTGIYASGKAGISYLTLTHTQSIPTDDSSTEVPLYLFACNNRGNYQGGISGVGISGCKIYKNNVLVRDFVPVQYYDLIGTQVAPSNCLYDKVTQTFFEDATRKNSFNIIDDDEYTDTNPLHQIGKIYINYYQADGFFQNRVVYFRGNELTNGTFDLDQVLDVDKYQPRFYGSPTVSPSVPAHPTFEWLNNRVFEVNYPRIGYYITMNYYKDTITPGNLLGSDRVYLVESMFYQVPTFGQLFDLLKYKPEGYKLEQENIPYTQNKVTLERILQSQPYDVVYTPIVEEEEYNFTVKYYKHKNVIDPKHPLNQYEYIGSQNITVGDSEIIDGVYPEKFINFNLMKPAGEENYWTDGQPFEWYTEDENLISPDVLKDEYIIVYEPIQQSIEIKYYTDEIDPDDYNLIASDSWSMNINDWGFGEEFQIVDELPNSYINKYKPITCTAGELQNPDRWYTFDSLVKQGHIDILYMTKVEPHDPDDDSFPDKVLLWYADIKDRRSGNTDESMPYSGEHMWQFHAGHTYPSDKVHNGLKIPYINLGYTPKEIGRLSIQTKAYSLADSCWDGAFGQNFGPITDAYTYFLGYMGAPSIKDIYASIGYDNGKDTLFGYYGAVKNQSVYSVYSSASTGWLAFRGHIPVATGFSKQFNSVCNVDGNNGWEWSNDAQLFVRTLNAFKENVKELVGGFRLGKYASKDENLNYYIENHDYIYKYRKRNSSNYYTSWIEDAPNVNPSHEAVSWSNGMDFLWFGMEGKDSGGPYQRSYTDKYGTDWSLPTPVIGNVYESISQNTDYEWYEWFPAAIFHPTTMTIDAYHRYIEVYDISNDQNPTYQNLDLSQDYDLFVDRCKPKGPIRLFTTTNPDTGEPNLLLYSFPVKPWTKNYKTKITSTTGGHQNEEDEQAEQGSQNQPGGTNDPTSSYESHGGLLEMAYNPYTTAGIDCPWSDFSFNAVPCIERAAVWNIKIWDRGKLVRDMIPVAQGDNIFDYVAPYNGLFDKITEIFFTTENRGGEYNPTERTVTDPQLIHISSSDVYPLIVKPDPTQYGKIVVNYYDYDNSFLGNKWVKIPTDYFASNISFKDLLAFNDYKPSLYYHDGMLDTDTWLETEIPTRLRLKQVYNSGSINVYYKQKQYTKTVVYYNENTRIASKDFFFSQHEIEEANTLADLGIDPELYRTDEFKPGVVMSDETIIASDDVAAFIDAPSPIVVYHKYTKEERPDLFYVEYYRGGAYEPEGEESIVLNSENKNYLDCDLTAVVLNPKGLIKYVNHYHSALYEDEEMPYFISYQVDITANYVPIHKGPARAYTLLAHITDRGRYTIIEERNGWGRLKEYPKGWILLKYTKPIVGPGQNPDYDSSSGVSVSIVGSNGTPVKVNVGIPFGTRLSITKMTIDRLWAYTPEYGSWIKTEEISFDQQGRLYSALAMNVYHLDQLDWNNINDFSDVAGDIQRFKLRFHDNSDFVFDGTVSQETLSDLHSVDIVYPETIYPYVVKYYQNIIDEDNVIGRGAFSCSVSDWNPDWDTFLTTSYLSGYDAKTSTESNFYRVVGKTETKYMPANEDIYILGTGTYNNTNCYYAMWGGYVGYIPRSNVTIVDSTIHTISPVLYRDTPLSLTWDYFNLDRNLYKPDYSFTDGIIVWNPHTYDNEIFDFTFEELITTGGQKILYVPQVDTQYKASFNGGFYKIYLGINNFEYFPTNENPGTWDFEVKYKHKSYHPTFTSSTDTTSEWNNHMRNEALYTQSLCMQTGSNLYGFDCYIDNNGFTGESYISQHKNFQNGINAYLVDYRSWLETKIVALGNSSSTNSTLYKYYEGHYYDGSIENEYYNIINFSNKRSYKQAIAQKYGNNNWESQVTFYPRSRQKNSGDEKDSHIDLDYLNIGSGAPIFTGRTNQATTNNTIASTGSAEYHYIKVWHNYELIHYYVPLPKGYWLPNGTQAPEIGFYDLITQQFTYAQSTGQYGGNTINWNGNSRPTILKAAGGAVDYFLEWQYQTQEVEYTVEAKEDIPIYQYPDALSKQVGTIEAKTIFPVRLITDDEENHVQGLWYNTSIGWVQATKCQNIIYDKTINQNSKRIALKGDISNTSKNYYGYLVPDQGIEQTVDCDYFTIDSSTKSIPTNLRLKHVGKIDLIVSGHLAPTDSGQYTYHTEERYGYIFGNTQLQVNQSILNASTTRTDVQYHIEIIYEDGYFVTYVDGVQKSRIADPSDNGAYDNYREYSLMIGSPYGSVSSRAMAGQANVNYHMVKIYDRNNVLIRDYVPKLKYNANIKDYELKVYNNNQSVYWYTKAHRTGNAGWSTPTVGTAIFSGDYAPVANFMDPVGTKNTFSTERLHSIYFDCNDFYWDGVMWIPVSYTDDYKVIWDTPKTYIVKVTNIYSFKNPIQEAGYRKTNYLAGDRFNVIGNLGKDRNWFLLEDGSWMFNNDTFEELVV